MIGKIVKVKGLGGFFYGLDAMYAAGLPYSLVMYSVYQPMKRCAFQSCAGVFC